MKTPISSPRVGEPILAVLLSLGAAGTLAEGIPEPSLIVYGIIEDTATSTRLTVGTLEWTFQPAGGGDPVIVSGELANINDQFSYVLQVPCETPIPGETASSNTLQLAVNPTRYDFAQITLGGEVLSLVFAGVR